MKRAFIILLAAGFIIPAAGFAAKNTELTILYTGDIQGQFEPAGG